MIIYINPKCSQNPGILRLTCPRSLRSTPPSPPPNFMDNINCDFPVPSNSCHPSEHIELLPKEN